MSTALLERRAERGVPRGSANIWAELHALGPEPQPPKSSTWGFRIAVAALAAVVGFGVFGITNNTTTETTDFAAPVDGDTPIVSDDPLPEPYLANGLALRLVAQPDDPDFDADDLFGEPGTLPPAKTDANNEIIVFAQGDDAFDGPIFGIEILEDGTTDSWSANLSAVEFAELDASLTEEEGRWMLPAENGLSQVAQFQTQPELRRSQQWDFGFVDTESLESVILLANPIDEAGQWVNIAAFLSGTSEPSVAESITIDGVDEPGIRIQRDPRDKDFDGVQAQVDEGVVVLWETGDFSYTLSSQVSFVTPEGFGDVDLGLATLESGDRESWISAVSASSTLNASTVFTPGSVIFGLLASFVVLAAAFGIRRVALRPERMASSEG